MKQNYLRAALVSLMSLGTVMASAIDYPKYPTQTPVVGGQYVLANLAVPTGYMSRTGWDGAYYFLGENDSHYDEHAFTAQKDEDGRWFFTTSEALAEVEEGEEPYTVYTYVGIPAGTDNLNGNLTEEAYFALEPGVMDGFYMIKALEGNYNATQGKFLHLNAGGQYFVISEPSQGWYPDFYGGVKLEEDGTPVYVYDEDTDQTLQVMADSTSMNWAFVHVEDVPLFVRLGNAYTYLANFEKNYLGIEDYAEGFKATLNAVLPLYNADDFTVETYEALRVMVQAKIDLYNQIQKALDLDADALSRAIEAAKAAFAVETSAEALAEAQAALVKAMNDYSLGLGDITSMGQNMSFEDLSAQNGSESSTVAPAPQGWTVFVGGQQLAEGATDLVSSFNWHGVNSDCTGYKEGNVGFGIWAAAVPEYQISQTITGLENGTYTVTAGLMLDYRRTTQRLFGNLNSTLFGFEEGYTEGILPLEYKSYAGLTECTDERTLQQLSVRAYVYDGTLTFGVKTNGDRSATTRESGASGDGWFKVDNFTIEKEGFVADDQQNLFNYLQETLEDLAAQPMNSEWRDTFSDFQAGEDLDAAIAQLATLIPEAEAQANAYAPLTRALELADARQAECEDAGYLGAGDFLDVIADIRDRYDAGVYTAEEIPAAVAELEEAYQTCLRSGIDEGAEVSDLIINRSFEDLTAQGGNVSDGTQAPPTGWELRVNGVLCETVADLNAQGISGWCAINRGDGINIEENGQTYTHQYTDGDYLWGIWNSTIPQVELSQELTGLKAGTYLLTADVMVDGATWAGNNLTTQRIFANDVVCLYGGENLYWPEYLAGTTSDDIYRAWNLTNEEYKFLDEDEGYDYYNCAGWDETSNGSLLRTLMLHFGVDETGTARIGFRTDNLDGTTGELKGGNGWGWFKLDNFRLYYESSKIPTGINDVPVSASNVQGNALYDLSGRRVVKAQKGIYIQNGKKVVK